MICRMTWIPDSGVTETLTVDLPHHLVDEILGLIDIGEWNASEAVAWIPYRSSDDQPFVKGLFRLARIIALESA